MANVIKLRKGLDINLKGKAAEELVTVKEPGLSFLWFCRSVTWKDQAQRLFRHHHAGEAQSIRVYVCHGCGYRTQTSG